LGGQTRFPERFAIDWIKLGEGGKAWHDDPKINANWYCYGTEVLAVADGVITAVKDGIPENVSLSAARAVPITLETISSKTLTPHICIFISAMTVLWHRRVCLTFSTHSKCWEPLNLKQYSPMVGCLLQEFARKGAFERSRPRTLLEF
jgi:hypothetical protein